MIKIRLSRQGAKNDPFYRIVAVESTRKIGGNPLEILGFWNPRKEELELKRSKMEKLIAQGAQMSQTVSKLINRKGA